MAESRPNLEHPKTISGTSSVFTFLGHREDVVRNSTSEDMAKRLKRKVVVGSALHWEGLQDERIEEP